MKLFSHLRSHLRMATLVACFAAFAWSGYAQEPDGMGPGGPPPGGGPGQERRGPNTDQEVKKLTQLLNLSTDQQTQVKTILTDRNQQIQALFQAQFEQRTAESGPPEPPSRESMQAMRKKMQTIRDASKVKIVAVLTADQKAKYEAFSKKSDRSAQRDMDDDDMPPPPPDGGGPGGGPGGGGPPDA